MLARTYGARKAAGMPDAQARNASVESGGVAERCSGIRSDLSQIHTDIAYIRQRCEVLIWVVGINAAATIVILGVLLRH